MKQGEAKLEREKGQAKIGWTRVWNFATSYLNLWFLSPSTTAMGLETEGYNYVQLLTCIREQCMCPCTYPRGHAGVVVNTLGSQPRRSGFESQIGWREDKFVLLKKKKKKKKRCNLCSPRSTIGAGVSQGFVTLQFRQVEILSSCVCVCVCVFRTTAEISLQTFLCYPGKCIFQMNTSIHTYIRPGRVSWSLSGFLWAFVIGEYQLYSKSLFY